MKHLVPTALVFALAAALSPSPAAAGGAWVPEPGKGDVEIGFSRKTASTSWNAFGDTIVHTTVLDGERVRNYHDFRYGYFTGEIGLFRNLSGTFVVTYLDGLEGPKEDAERNKGLSDSWFGLKYSLRQGSTPMALGFIYRTPVFYDQPGAYNRHRFDSNGRLLGLSSEWRGLLKHDYTFVYLVSHSIQEGRGWGNLQVGYTLREGAPANEIPIWGDLGYPLPFWSSNLKVSGVFVHSLGNDSPRQPDDRFGGRADYNFNDASMGRAGLALVVPIGHQPWTAELGYNKWLWGRSARQYEEPYISINRRF